MCHQAPRTLPHAYFSESHGRPRLTTAALSFPRQHHSRGNEPRVCPSMAAVTKYWRLGSLKTIGFHLSVEAEEVKMRRQLI